MVIHAYSDDYLTSAQRILGDMLDFAVNTYDMDIDKFFEILQNRLTLAKEALLHRYSILKKLK